MPKNRVGITVFNKLRALLKVGAKAPLLCKLLKYERSSFWVTDMRYECDKSGLRLCSFPWVDMGNLDINKDSPVYPDGLSRNILSLRPPSVILIVPQVNFTHYWSDSRLGWEPQYKARHDRKCTKALSVFIAGFVDSLAVDPRAQPVHIRLTCSLSVRRVLI
eukprot:6212609-Pleurochrysis_carterae.AAC.1